MKSSQQIKHTGDLKQLGTILSIWAHPDDETFCAGGLLAAAVKNGQKIVCITATKGDKGVQDEEKWPADKLGEIRSKELDHAMKILGIKEHYWLKYMDGECHNVDHEEAAKMLATHIEKIRPDTILTFGPEGLTGHTDHQAVSKWVDRAIEHSGSKAALYHPVLTVRQYKKYLQSVDEKLNVFYNIEHPPLVRSAECDICFCCTDSLCRCKQEAFEAMPSQYTKMQESFSKQYLMEAFRIEAFIKG